MRIYAAALLALAFGTSALAADADKAKDDGSHLNYIPYGNLQNAKPEDVARAAQEGAEMAKQMLQVYERNKSPAIEQIAKSVKRRADDIADSAIAADRDEILRFLGIDNSSSTALYYFLTWDMPLEMLRSYAIDAMWSGGTLVFKGVPPGKQLSDFLLKDLRQLVYGKGASANLSLDPRLFDAYQVKVAPTIVVTNVRANFSCQGIEKVYFKVDKQTLSYDSCPPLDPSQYNKMSGAVTTRFALQTFLDDGAKEVEPFLKALAKGYSGEKTPGKEQVGFTGSWENVWAPVNEMNSQKSRTK